MILNSLASGFGAEAMEYIEIRIASICGHRLQKMNILMAISYFQCVWVVSDFRPIREKMSSVGCSPGNHAKSHECFEAVRMPKHPWLGMGSWSLDLAVNISKTQFLWIKTFEFRVKYQKGSYWKVRWQNPPVSECIHWPSPRFLFPFATRGSDFLL